MIAEISTLITSSKAAYEIAKGLKSVCVDDKVKERTSELLGILLSVQAAALEVQSNHHELLKEKDQLEKKILKFENWTETERQYELKEVASGIFVYAYKKSISASEPDHWLCAKCFNEKHKSILQRTSKTMAGIRYICHTCKSEILDHSQSTSPNHSSPRGGIDWDQYT